MKVESITIENFKRFNRLEVAFKNALLDEISDRFLIVGDNGSGKTTLLQAVALPLALATGAVRSIEEFDWIGFLPGRYARWGNPTIELIVTFSPNEIEATQEVARRWYESRPQEQAFTEPGSASTVSLRLHGGRFQGYRPEELYQFRGRYYASQLLRIDPAARAFFKELPGVFWFDQYRNLGTPPAEQESSGSNGHDGGRVPYDLGVGRLREYLNGWKLAQQQFPRRIDYLMELENLYKRVFPGRSFAGIEEMPGVDAPTAKDFYFLLNDGSRTYDIVEMSAGEQTVFPVLYNFVRLQIAHSVVLIDEVDLNLHPPPTPVDWFYLPVYSHYSF
jgi:energy-coupling factor transporter ATP-binding protein EcfA2